MIVHLADYAAEYTGNFIYSLIELAKNTDRILNKNTLIIFPLEAKSKEWINLLKENNIYVDFVDIKTVGKNRINEIKKLINKYKKNPKIIHTHFARFEMVGIELKKYYNCKLVWHMHMGYKRDTFKHKLYDIYKIRYMANKYVDIIMPVSEYVKNLMLDRGTKEKKIKVVYNGICLNKHNKNLEQRNFERSKLKIDYCTKVILMFGYSVETKGTDIIFKSIENVEGNVKFIFVGRNYMQNYIKKQEKYKKYKDKIIMIDHVENISKIFNIADVFISSSRIEAFSYSIGEAMLYEIPIIMSDIEGTKFYKEAGDGVITYNVENYNKLAECINYINNIDDIKFNNMGLKNKEFIEKNFSVNRWCNEICNIYESLVK